MQNQSNSLITFDAQLKTTRSGQFKQLSPIDTDLKNSSDFKGIRTHHLCDAGFNAMKPHIWELVNLLGSCVPKLSKATRLTSRIGHFRYMSKFSLKESFRGQRPRKVDDMLISATYIAACFYCFLSSLSHYQAEY